MKLKFLVLPLLLGMTLAVGACAPAGTDDAETAPTEDPAVAPAEDPAVAPTEEPAEAPGTEAPPQ